MPYPGHPFPTHKPTRTKDVVARQGHQCLSKRRGIHWSLGRVSMPRCLLRLELQSNNLNKQTKQCGKIMMTGCSSVNAVASHTRNTGQTHTALGRAAVKRSRGRRKHDGKMTNWQVTMTSATDGRAAPPTARQAVACLRTCLLEQPKHSRQHCVCTPEGGVPVAHLRYRTTSLPSHADDTHIPHKGPKVPLPLAFIFALSAAAKLSIHPT